MPLEKTVEDKPETEEVVEDPYITNTFDYIEELVDDLGLPEEVSEAAKNSVEKLDIRIRQHYEAGYMAAATVQLESRKLDAAHPRTIKQVSTSLESILETENHLTGKTNYKKKTNRTVKKLKKHQDIRLKPELSEDYLPRLLKEFELGQEVQDTAWNILKEVRGSQELQGKCQMGIAAAFTYIAAEEHGKEISVDKLADVSCRNKKTIRDSARLVENQLPENWEP